MGLSGPLREAHFFYSRRLWAWRKALDDETPAICAAHALRGAQTPPPAGARLPQVYDVSEFSLAVRPLLTRRAEPPGSGPQLLPTTKVIGDASALLLPRRAYPPDYTGAEALAAALAQARGILLSRCMH